MILSPTQWKTLRDCYALSVLLQSDARLNEEAKLLAQATSELIETAEEHSEKEELTAPF